MRRLVSIAVFFAIFAFVPMAAQDDGPHMYTATYIKEKPDKVGEYTKYWNEILAPMYEEFVKHDDMASYHMLGMWSGTGEYSHVFIIEWVNWDAMNDGLTAVGSESWEAACQAAHGMTWAEAAAEVDFAAIREIVRRDVTWSIKP